MSEGQTLVLVVSFGGEVVRWWECDPSGVLACYPPADVARVDGLPDTDGQAPGAACGKFTLSFHADGGGWGPMTLARRLALLELCGVGEEPRGQLGDSGGHGGGMEGKRADEGLA